MNILFNSASNGSLPWRLLKKLSNKTSFRAMIDIILQLIIKDGFIDRLAALDAGSRQT